MKRFAAVSAPSAARAFSLIELVVVVAIVGIFAVALLRALLKEADFTFSNSESLALRNCGEALKRAITRHRTIPGHNEWTSFTAAELGLEPSQVAQNSRRNDRILLIDSSGCFGTVTLPFEQNELGLSAAGTNVEPKNARFMIVSSVGPPLTLTPGLTPYDDFETLWTNAPGTLPTRGPLASWNGRPTDLKLERIDLSPLFVRIYLQSDSKPVPALYSVGTGSTYDANVGKRYFLINTLLELYRPPAPGNIDSQLVLTKNGSYMYESGRWKSSGGGGIMPGGMDIAGAVDAFLKARPNKQAAYTNEQQRIIVSSMMSYMRTYIAWSKAGFPGDSGSMKPVTDNFDNMLLACQQMFMKIGNDEHYPVNNDACP